MTEVEPGDSSETADYQCRSPAPTRSQEEQQKIGEVKLLFDRECPENSVDAVASVRVEVVKHQEMHHDIVDKEMRDVDAGAQSRHQHEQSKSDQVRRIEPADATTPKRSKPD